MLSFSHTVRIFLHTEAVDLRKSFDGLSGLVSQAFPEEDLLSGHLFLFLNGRRDRLKILHWDADGLVIWYKKQESDCPHPLACTGIGGHPHNRAGRPPSAGGMGPSSTPGDPRRWLMSRGDAVVAPPRARRPFGHRRSTNSGLG
jgi:hypothetical protein